MIEIKICGITNKKEIEYLNILKPEYVGFVFTKSKRQVTGNVAKELSENLDEKIKTVGVFKDNPIEEILDIISVIHLDVIQLHGKEDSGFISSLKESLNDSINIWKALSIKDVENIKKYTKYKISTDNNIKLIDNLLIDGDNPGSGEVFSLENLSEYFLDDDELKHVDNGILKKYNFFLAGGITEENVIERIAKANPSGIDVSSGVEIIGEDGKRTKSFEKMKSLIDKVRAMDNCSS